MNDFIIDSIAEDLRISKLKNSLTPEEYRKYTIYSAAALWAKVSTQDRSINQETGSRRHVINVCSRFIEKAIQDEPDSVKQYFVDSNTSNQKSAAVQMIDSLIRIGEINETGTNPDKLHVSLPFDGVIQIDDKYQITQGLLGTEDFHGIRNYELLSGLCFINRGSDGSPITTISNSVWVEKKLEQLDKSMPSRTELLEEDRYFDIKQYGKYKFTRKVGHEDYPFEVVQTQTVGAVQYYVKTKKGFYLFDDFSVQIRDHYRFMIYLVSFFNNKIIRMTEKGDIIRIDSNLSLPLLEDSNLRRVMWPCRNITDSGSFVGPLFLKSFIINVLSSLGLEI